MPAKWFICPDGERIEIEQCLKNGGCRMKERCATRPFLRLIGYDREWKGVTPSSAGSGPRLLYLKAMTNYAINPNDRVWAAFGTGTHGKLSLHKYSSDVLVEEELSDEDSEGIPDVLEESENKPGTYVLTDYKTWGSYKLMLALGGGKVALTDENGEPILLKSGKNKGQPKQKYVLGVKPPELDAEELQLNRYRIFFEKYGFPVSEMVIQAIPRDGGTYVAFSRGIEKNLYIIPIKRLPDEKVINFYNKLQSLVDSAFETGYIRKCNKWESWDGRRCESFCEVKKACEKMGD